MILLRCPQESYHNDHSSCFSISLFSLSHSETMHAFKSFIGLLSLLSLMASTAALSSPSRVVRQEDLPTLDAPVPVEPPTGVTSKEFYLPTYTLLRSGPVSFARRLVDSKGYQSKVFKYMNDYKEDSLMTAQGNADAYLASPGKCLALLCSAMYFMQPMV